VAVRYFEIRYWLRHYRGALDRRHNRGEPRTIKVEDIEEDIGENENHADRVE
jgi:hypothetical protein